MLITHSIVIPLPYRNGVTRRSTIRFRPTHQKVPAFV